jgi:hypothetical protein
LEAEKKEIGEERTSFMARWHVLVGKHTEEDFWVEWRSIVKDYAAYPSFVTYLEQHHIPYQDEWAEWCCGYLPDFGIKVTSRAHHHLKRHLTFSPTGHLFNVVRDIDLMLQAKRNKLKVSVQ